jgi:hypothetical protein
MKMANIIGLVREKTSAGQRREDGAVRSKLKCPLFVASEMSGFGF